MKLKIGGKIVLLAFILVLGTAGAVGLISYKGFNRLLVQHELDALGEELELHGIRLGFGIETLRRDVIFLAHTPPIQGIARARRAGGVDPLDGSAEEVWRGRLEAIFTEFLRSRPHYTQARFIGVSSQGREIARVDRLGESIVTVDGPDLQLKGHRLYFRESIRLKEGQVYLSDITLNRERGEVALPRTPMLRAAMPVYTPEGAVFGIVVVNMDFSSALEKIRTEQHLNYVTNDKGDFLAHPDASKVFGFDLGRRHRIQETYPKLEEMFSPDHAAREILVLAGEGDNAFAVHFIKVPFDPLRPERFFGLAQTASYRDVVAQSSAVRNQILAWTLLLMAVAAGLVLLFVRPLRQIAQTAEGFAGEMSDSPLPVESQDEIGSLARSFQSMVDKVKAGTKALKESEARVTAVLNNTVDGIIVIDERGIVETFNPAAEKTFGYAASEVIGQNISMLAPEPHRSQHDEYIQKYLNTGEAKIIGIGREVPGLRKDGSIFPVDLAISEMFIGERRLFIGVTRDITERRKMEKQLEAHAVSLEKMVEERTHALIESLDVAEQARNRIDGILKSIADGLIVIDAEHKIMLINRPAEQILGISAQTAIGQPAARFFSDEIMREQVKVALDKKASGDPFDFELRGRDSKHPRIIRARTAAILDKSGGEVGAVTIMHDVTHEHKVDRMKTEFVSTVAHELRTPLTSIKGFAELLQFKKNISPEKKNRYLFRIVEEAGNLTNIINDLLDIQRIESGKSFSLEKTNCDIGNIVKDVVSLFREGTKKHWFEIDLPPQPVYGLIDQEKIEQALKNLLSNAIKYSPEGGMIRVMVDSNDGYFRISIEDRGIGMTCDQTEKIFEKFYRAHGSSGNIEGTGLGMAIVKDIVDAHEGEIQIESKPGVGTTVRISFPK